MWSLLRRKNELKPNDIESLATHICSALVDFPDDLKITTTATPSSLLMEVTTRKENVGSIIGAGGKNANAIRHILTAVARKNGLQLHFNVDAQV